MLIDPYRYAAAGGTDPFFPDVSLLLHMQGTNGGTSFPDSSSNAFSITAGGNAQTSTTDPKWGSACGLFDGTGDYVETFPDAAFDFGTGNFTIQWWARHSSVSGNQYYYENGADANLCRILNGSGLLIYDSGAAVINTTIPTLNANQWYHMAYERSGNTRNFYVDGSSVATASNSRSTGNASLPFRIGLRANGSFGFAGRFQDWRITKGVARGGTVPTGPFPNS